MTEKEKMLAGEVYSAVDPELIEELMATREVLYEYNFLRPSETQRMKEILKGLLGHVADDDFLINQPFKPVSPLAMTVLSALMSASIRPVIVQTRWSATPVWNGQNLFLSVIMYGLEVA